MQFTLAISAETIHSAALTAAVPFKFQINEKTTCFTVYALILKTKETEVNCLTPVLYPPTRCCTAIISVAVDISISDDLA